MKFVENIIKLFSSEYTVTDIVENNSEFSCSLSVTQPHKPNNVELNNILASVSIRDTIKLVFYSESSEDTWLNYSGLESINNFLSEYENKLTFIEKDDKCILTVNIVKSRNSKDISVYSLDNMVGFWSKDGLVNTFIRLQDLAASSHILHVMDHPNTIKTSCFAFSPFKQNTSLLQIDRSTLHSKRDKIGHFANAAQFGFVPEDFNFDCPPENQLLSKLFDKLKLIASLIYICDFSRFSSNNNIHLRLNGYRLFSKRISSTENISNHSTNEYYEIYKWIYNEGNIIDKAGLARNVISLHLSHEDLLNVGDNTLQSISSGYQIYLKDNVKQYIEIKNKLSEFIQNSSDKASDIVKNVGGYYKNSVWTMYSFFASVFLLRILSNKNDSRLVTDEIFAIFVVFFIITLFVMRHALKELDEDKARFIESYISLKNRYCDLLLPEDLNNILDNDKQHLNDISYIDRKKSSFRMLWGGSLTAIFCVIGLLWAANK